MSWGSNNYPNGQHSNIDESLKSFMSQTPNNMPLPSPFVQVMRGRLNSMNSFVSPMRLITSPQLNDADNLFQFQLKPADKQQLEKFSLDAQNQPVEEEDEVPREDDSQPEEPTQNINEVTEQVVQARELIRSVTQNLGTDDAELERCRKRYAEEDDPQYLAVFDLLVRKLKKVKKTKEQMIKYCMRKVFRHLSQKIRNELTVGPRDNSQCLKYYFSKYENDKTFNVPFKKNSVQKTMNSNFLAKVFSCPLFVEDYRKYMKTFRIHAQRDNHKKIDTLAKIIGKGIQTKNLRKIDTFKRLPWTQLIINRAEELAISLLDYSKASNFIQEMEPEKHSPQAVHSIEKREDEEALRELKTKQVKKGSIILLTPPLGPLSSPPFQDKKLEEILKHCE